MPRPRSKDRIAPAIRKYAVPRSDYIHPLYGLHGEILTEDWAPTIRITAASTGPGRRSIGKASAAICTRCSRSSPGPREDRRRAGARTSPRSTAENEWRWEDGTPRSFASRRSSAPIARPASGRRDRPGVPLRRPGTDVQVARRGQTHYGGLNVRLGPSPGPEDRHVHRPGHGRTRSAVAWAHRSGTPRGGQSPTALTILQSPESRLSGRLGASIRISPGCNRPSPPPARAISSARTGRWSCATGCGFTISRSSPRRSGSC